MNKEHKKFEVYSDEQISNPKTTNKRIVWFSLIEWKFYLLSTIRNLRSRHRNRISCIQKTVSFRLKNHLLGQLSIFLALFSLQFISLRGSRASGKLEATYWEVILETFVSTKTTRRISGFFRTRTKCKTKHSFNWFLLDLTRMKKRTNKPSIKKINLVSFRSYLNMSFHCFAY